MTDHPLDGARAKLERANENIANLEREIAAFLELGNGVVITQEEIEAFQKALEFHESRIVPIKFSVMAGEVIHQLRSCLDHIAWQISSVDTRESSPTSIEFPIFLSKPSDPNTVASYERKVKGISPAVRDLIERIQPYQRDDRFALTGPPNDQLWIIHDFDRIDKHRELVLTVAAFRIEGAGQVEFFAHLYREADFPERDIAGLSRTLDPNCEISPDVVFRDFGRRKMHPVIPGLSKLSRHVGKVIDAFERDCF